jgi:hypothetical protein
MGWDINVYRMDFERLKKIHGCRNERLLQQIISASGLDEPDEAGEDEEDYDENDAPLRVKQALRNILFGEVPDETPDPGYGDAMTALYEALAAEYIGDLRVAVSGIPSFFGAVDAVLAERGFPGYLSNLVMGGSPIAVPVDSDGALGFLSPADCERVAREHAHHNWEAVEPGLKATVNDLLTWCTAAAKHGHGLVSVGG